MCKVNALYVCRMKYNVESKITHSTNIINIREQESKNFSVFALLDNMIWDNAFIGVCDSIIPSHNIIHFFFPILLLLRLLPKLPIKGKLSPYDTTSTKEDFIWSIGFIFYLLIKLNRGHNNNSTLEHNFMQQLSNSLLSKNICIEISINYCCRFFHETYYQHK